MEVNYEPAEILPIGKKKYFCVEYPGYVKRTQRAIDTLGGEKVLGEALASNSTVHLKFRAADTFSHPITGHISSTSKLLVKVTRRVKKNKSTDQLIEDPTWKIQVEGVVTKALRFRALADFQYLVPKTDSIRQLKDALIKGDVQHIIDYKVAVDDNNEDLRNIPPPVFTAIELPLPYGYRQNAPVVRVRVKQPDGSYTIKLVNRSIRRALEITTVRFREENMPTKSWFILVEPKEKEEIAAVEAVRELFLQRHIWSRSNIRAQLPSMYHKHLKTALVQNAYTFADGPWRDFWVKYGIDPKKDPKYKIYQQVDVRRNFALGPKPKITRQLLLRRQLDGAAVKSEELIVNEEPEGMFYFDGVAVPKPGAVYQMSEITDPDISPLIQTPAYSKAEATKLSGYYYECVNLRIRKALRTKHINLIEHGKTPRMFDLEDGLLKEIEIEREKARKLDGYEEEEDEEETEASVGKENAVKEAMQAMDKPGSSKRLTEVVDEYMDELVKGEPLDDDDFIDMDTLEDYDEELDGFEEDNEEIDKDVIMKE